MKSVYISKIMCKIKVLNSSNVYILLYMLHKLQKQLTENDKNTHEEEFVYCFGRIVREIYILHSLVSERPLL